MERIGTTPSIRAAAKLLLLTMVRKSELTNATLSEINFTEALWTIPKERMKRRNPHLVFLSRQALDIFIALKTFAGGSEFRLEVAQLAGMHGLKVTFTDPAMEQMRRETAEHKEMEKAFQAEVHGQTGTQVREGSKSAAATPQRGKKRPEGRSNELT